MPGGIIKISATEKQLKSVLKMATHAALGMSLLASLTVPAVAEEVKVGFVSTERIFREAAPAKAATAKLEQEFSRREKDLQELAAKVKSGAEKLDKDAPVLSESERAKRQRELSEMDKDFQRRQREFREDLNQRRNEELATVLEKANKVIKQLAESEKYDIVFQEAVYYSPRIDITDKVLKALNK